MPIVATTTLKGYFETGDYPTESNFEDLIDTLTNSQTPLYDTFQALRDAGTPSATDARAFTTGKTTRGDGYTAIWVWTAAETTSDDGETYLLPTGHLTDGRWVRTEVADKTIDIDPDLALIDKVYAKLIGVYDTDATAGNDIFDIPVEAGYDYQVIARGLGSSGATGITLDFQVGDGTSYETGNFYRNVYEGWGSVGGAFGADALTGTMTTIAIQDTLTGTVGLYGFDAILGIGDNSMEGANWIIHGNGRSVSAGHYTLNGIGYITGSAKSSITRFRLTVPSGGEDVVGGGKVFVYRLAKEIS